METPAGTRTTAVWSFILPLSAMVIGWSASRSSYPSLSAGALAGLAALFAAGAAAGLVLVSRSYPCRGWAIAGAVTSVLAVVSAIGAALLAVLVSALSHLTF